MAAENEVWCISCESMSRGGYCNCNPRPTSPSSRNGEATTRCGACALFAGAAAAERPTQIIDCPACGRRLTFDVRAPAVASASGGTPEPDWYPCGTCGKPFKNPGALDAHRAAAHHLAPIAAQGRTPNEPFADGTVAPFDETVGIERAPGSPQPVVYPARLVMRGRGTPMPYELDDDAPGSGTTEHPITHAMFVYVVRGQVDNEGLSDALFRQMLRNTLVDVPPTEWDYLLAADSLTEEGTDVLTHKQIEAVEAADAARRPSTPAPAPSVTPQGAPTLDDLTDALRHVHMTDADRMALVPPMLRLHDAVAALTRALADAHEENRQLRHVLEVKAKGAKIVVCAEHEVERWQLAETELAEARERVAAAREQYHRDMAQVEASRDHALRTVEALTAERTTAESSLARLRATARACADDLEAEVKARYGWPDVHPSQQRRFENDMAPVHAVRAAAPQPPKEAADAQR